METKEEFVREIERVLSESKKAIKEAQNYLIGQGEVVDFSEWVTIKEYCKRFKMNRMETVLNWIDSGVIPQQNIQVVEEFDHTILIKAKPYKAKTS